MKPEFENCDGPGEDSTPASYRYVVDESELTTTEPELTGGQILARVDKDPRTHFLVLLIPGQDDLVIETDDTVDFREPGKERFAVVARGRQYPFFIDEDRHVLNYPNPTGAVLLELAKKASDKYRLVQIIPHGDDLFIELDQEVDLAKPGTEKFITVLNDCPGGHPPEELFIFVNRLKKTEKDGVKAEMTRAEIAGLAGVPAANAVVKRDRDGQQETITTDDPFLVCKGEHFLVTRDNVQGGHA